MATIFLEPYVRPLLVLHGLLAGAAVGLLTHHTLWVLGRHADRPVRRRQARLFLQLGALCSVVDAAIGLLIYPTYRVRVRLEIFDHPVDGRAPLRWVSGLFDFKEHSSSILLALLLALWGGEKLLDEVQAGRFPALGRTLYQGLSVAAALIAWEATIVGLWVSSYRGLPTGGP